MAMFIGWLVVLGAVLASGYWQMPRLRALGVVGIALLLVTFSAALGGWVLLPWLLYLPAAVLLLMDDLRRERVTRRVLDLYRQLLPQLSDTERQAMQAGTVWWDGELFSGRPDWDALLALRGTGLTTDERAFLDGPVERLCAMIDDWAVTDRDRDLSPQVWQYLRDEGFFGLVIPRKYGGLGFSARAHSEVVIKVASRSIAAGVTTMVPNSLGPGELLLHYGTEQQREHYLPRLARGEEIPCFALTGPEAGSDASAMPDTGVVCEQQVDGEKVLGLRLNFSKRYITLAPVATLIGLAFNMQDPDGLLGDQPELGITVALVPADTPGITIGSRHNPLNVPFQNGPIQGHDVFVPLEQIVGGQDGIGQGWRMLVESLSAGRGISLPALSAACTKMVSRYTGAYARIREQFHLPVGRFEAVAEVLARIAGRTYQTDAARHLTVLGLDQGERPAVLTAILKYHATERMRQVVNDGMDIQGGSGIMMGPDNFIGRAYQALPIGITVEGANILTRGMIIFGQGAVRAHPWVLKEMDAAADDTPAGLADFDDALLGHAGYLFGNLCRSLVLGVTGGRLSGVPQGALRRELQQLNGLAAAFAALADVAMLVFGGELKRREAISARLGDALSNLYLAAATVHRFQQQGAHQADLPLARWAITDCLHRGQVALREVLRNLPNAWLGRLLGWWLLPPGSRVAPPSDALMREVASLLLHPGESRDRLTAGIYQPAWDEARQPAQQEHPAQLDRAMELADSAEVLASHLREAIKGGRLAPATGEDRIVAAMKQGIIDAEQAEVLRLYEALRWEVIQVADFEALPGTPSAATGNG